MENTKKKVRLFGDPVLKKQCEEVTEFDDNLKELVDVMADALYEENGIGLAAPQVGVTKRVIIIDMSFGEEVDNILTVINPEILSSEGECSYEEGCLSVPGIYEEVLRPEKVTLRFQDVQGNVHEIEADSTLARVVQHEYDHLNGILFIDRLSSVKRNFLAKRLREIAEESN